MTTSNENKKHWRDYMPPEPSAFRWCPLMNAPCLAGACAWWDQIIKRCSIIAIKNALIKLGIAPKKF